MDDLELLYVGNKGEINKERVVLKAATKLNLNGYILVNAYTDGENYYDLNDKTFWFPSQTVNAGEYVRLYSKSGDHDQSKGKFKEEPAKFHNFYWGKANPVWDDARSNTAILVVVQKWNEKKI